jgi:hypothetical protein
MKPKLKLLVLGGILCGSISSFAQVTQKGETYLLRVKYTEGTVLKFSTSTTTSMSKNPIKMVVQMKVKKVTPVKSMIEFNLGGSTMNVEVDSRNKAIGSGAASAFTTFPEKPVKVGESWKGTTPMTGPTGGSGNVTTKYTFRGIKTEDGKKVAKIEVSVSGAMTSTGSMSVLVSDGTLYSMTSSLTMQSPQMSVSSVWKRS